MAINSEAQALVDVLNARLRAEPDKDGWALIARQADELARVARRQIKAIEAIDVVRARREAYKAERAADEAKREARRAIAADHVFEPKLDANGMPLYGICSRCSAYQGDHAELAQHKLELVVTQTQPDRYGHVYTGHHCRICGARAKAYRLSSNPSKTLWRH